MSDNPFARFQAPQQPGAQDDNPFANFRAPTAVSQPSSEDSFFTRLWKGLTGGDVSRAGRFGMGIADPAYGAARIGSRMPSGQGGGLFTMGTGLDEQINLDKPHTLPGPSDVDRTIREREQSYQQKEKSAGLSGGLSSEWARLAGNLMSPPNVAAAAVGGAASPASALGRIAAGVGVGAVQGALEPRTGSFGTDIAKGTAMGAAGGAAGSAVGEAAGSTLAKALVGNSPQAVDQALNRLYRTTVKPSRVGQTTAPQLGMQDRRITTAVDQIISNKQNLKMTDESGREIVGQLPRSLRQFSEAIDQTKKNIFKQYDAMAQGAGIKVELAPAIAKLREAASRPEVVDLHPGLAVEAEKLAQTFEARGAYTPSQAQDLIENLNKTLNGFYKNPTHETVSRASLLAPVASELRSSLDNAIEQSSGPGYQALKLQYGALRSVEKDVAAAVQREANKVPGGIGGIFLDAASSEEALRGILTLNPKALITAGTLKAAKEVNKYINSPNRAIAKLFARAEQAKMPGWQSIPSPGAESMASKMLGLPPTMAPLGGGVTAYPWQPQNP